MADPQHNSHDLSRYEGLLDEAARIQGTSLGRDAWRRLRRNPVAVVSMLFLILLAASSTFVPLLPLQSPTQQLLKERQYAAPNLEPVYLRVAVPESPDERIPFTKALQSLEEEISANVAKLQHDYAAATPEEKIDLTLKIVAERDRYYTLLNQLWAGPNLFDRLLIRLRLSLFGDWCIPSVFGTDSHGRDLLARIMWGSRVSLLVGIVATLVSLIIGVSYGATAGYVGGWLDNAMMRFVDILYSIPFIFVVIFLISILDEPKIKEVLLEYYIDKIVIFYLLIGAIYWLTMSRIVRGQVISLKNEQFIDAARTIGAGRRRIIFRHLVPNVLSIVIVYLTLTIPSVMLFEAFLSFLGMGVSPPKVSWGILAADGIKVITPIQTYWWLVVFPGLALALTLLALNSLGDGLRDALDPRLKNK